MNQEILWKGIDTSNVSQVKTYMQLQASYLGKMTNNVVEARVSTNLNIDDNISGFVDRPTVTYCFDILAPILDYKQFTLFCVEQTIGVELPLKIYSTYWNKKECQCQEMDDFFKCLKEIFASPEVTSLINSIIATSK